MFSMPVSNTCDFDTDAYSQGRSNILEMEGGSYLLSNIGKCTISDLSWFLSFGLLSKPIFPSYSLPIP